MQRRELLRSLPLAALSVLIGQRSQAMTPDEIKRQAQEYRRKALENFPLKLVETTGDQALAKWQELKSAGQGTPVVLGGDDEMHPFDNLLTPFGPNGPNVPAPPSVEEILKRASEIHFPDDLAKLRKSNEDSSLAWLKAELAKNPDMPLPTNIEIAPDGKRRTLSRAETLARLEAPPHEPSEGDWPDVPAPSPGLSVAYDILTNKPLPKVYIGIAPTDDWTTIPAFLRWGEWNDCPAPEYHVAAMRQWRDRYGAELVGISFDTMNLKVTKRPSTRGQALSLAHDQYVYCNDIIDQGVETYSALAATLMADDWWYFWWD